MTKAYLSSPVDTFATLVFTFPSFAQGNQAYKNSHFTSRYFEVKIIYSLSSSYVWGTGDCVLKLNHAIALAHMIWDPYYWTYHMILNLRMKTQSRYDGNKVGKRTFILTTLNLKAFLKLELHVSLSASYRKIIRF